MPGQLQSATRSRFDVGGAREPAPAGPVSHALHSPTRDWPQTNCYVDLWIEVVAARGFAPEAMLGFTLAQAFEGDQFTFFKPPSADLEYLYGLRVDELAIYDRLESHIEAQLARGAIVVLEVDGFYLPDTRGVSYRLRHGKTTIGVTRCDEDAARMDYFHNDGFFSLAGEDFDGVLGRLQSQRRDDALFPYAEFARFDESYAGAGRLHVKAQELLQRHFARRPRGNPLSAFARAFPQMWRVLEQRPPGFFNDFAFNTLRQLGANFELLGAHLDWLREDGRYGAESAECRALSAAAKALQFNIARAATRGRALEPGATLAQMASAYDRLMDGLAHKLDARS